LSIGAQKIGSDAILMTRWNAEHGIIESVQKDSFSTEGSTAMPSTLAFAGNLVAKNRESDQ
jgi:hypothetical protein